MNAEELRRAASSYKAGTGVGLDGFHSKVLLDLGSETCSGIVELLANMVAIGQLRPARFSFLFRRMSRVRGHLLLTQRERLRAQVIQEWKKRSTVK